METCQLIVAISPETIPDQWFRPGDRPVRWVYFGKNALSRIRLQKNLDVSFSELDIARPLDKVADKIRSEHVTWIDTINRQYGTDIRWWFGNISSRNIYSSDLFQYCCYLVLLEQIWENPDTKPSLIVVDSPGLASAIYQWANEKKIRVSIRGGYKRYARKIAGAGRFGMRWLDFIVRTALRKLASVTLRAKDIPKRSQDCDMVMISTFVHESGLSEDGVFEDRFFPGLYGYLQKNNKRVLVHPVFYGPMYNFFPVFRRISKSTTDFVVQEKYLNAWDYLRAWSYPVHLMRQKIVVPAFHGFNVNDMVREDHVSGDLQNTLQALLTLYFMQRLKMSGLKLHSVIDWYENQARDRAIVAGIRDAFPEIKTIGAQIFLHFPNFLSLSPSRSEVEAGIVPDILLSTSRYQCERSRLFAPALQCIPAAALRYTHVFDDEHSRESRYFSPQKTVLVLTAGIPDETIELLMMTRELVKHLGNDIAVRLQVHPDIRVDWIMNQVPEIQEEQRIKIVQGSMAEEIREASVVVSKSSGSIVEAIATGTPALFVGNRNKLNLNPMAGIVTPLLTECYSVDEVVDAVQKYLNASNEDRKEYRVLGRSIRDMFFLPVNEETLSPFLMP